MPTDPIRVLLEDDQLVVRRGLATLLLAFDDMLLVGEAENGAEAVALCATTQPDVILMDLLMPEMDGVAATHAIHERYPAIQVLAMTSFNEYDMVQRGLAAGAHSYLMKNSSAEEVASTLRGAHLGHPTHTPTSFTAMEPAAPTPEPWTGFGMNLTCRELEVLALLTRGLTNTQIGAQLTISRATVKFHVSSILSKLGAASRTEAAALAVQHHLANGPG
jgi:NarL family two-component system response regulator LiaR